MVRHVDTNEQRACILTKSMGRVKIENMRKLLGVEEIKSFWMTKENVGVIQYFKKVSTWVHLVSFYLVNKLSYVFNFVSYK